MTGGTSPRSDAGTLAAISHPTRVGILAHLRAHECASPVELAEALEVPLGSASYHVRRLADLGLIALHRRKQRRGSYEHFYKLAPVADTDHLVRYMTDAPAARAEPPHASASVLLDAGAIGELRAELERLFARMRALEAESVTRAGVNGAARTFAVDVSCVMGAARGSG